MQRKNNIRIHFFESIPNGLASSLSGRHPHNVASLLQLPIILHRAFTLFVTRTLIVIYPWLILLDIVALFPTFVREAMELFPRCTDELCNLGREDFVTIFAVQPEGPFCGDATFIRHEVVSVLSSAPHEHESLHAPQTRYRARPEMMPLASGGLQLMPCLFCGPWTRSRR